MKGHITRDLTMWCGLCDNWIHLEATEQLGAGQEARSGGWRKTLANGWVCPDHFRAPSSGEEKG